MIDFVKINQNLFLGITENFSNNRKIVEIINNIFSLISDKDPKIEKKTPTPHTSHSPITPIIKQNSDVNDLFNSKPVNEINYSIQAKANNTPNLFDFVNANETNNSANQNQEKKVFGFLKKKNTSTEETNITNIHEDIAVTNNINNNPDLFSLVGDANQAAAKPAEKTGFSFIKSSTKNKEQTSGSNVNSALDSIDFGNKSAVTANKNTNYDLLNEIYAQSIAENSNNNINASNGHNKNVNSLTENLNNLNFNSQSNYNSANAFGGLNYNNNNNNNYNNSGNYALNSDLTNGNFNYNLPKDASSNSNNANTDNFGNKRSSYVAPNFDVMFANSPDKNGPQDRKLKEKNTQNGQGNFSETNDKIDFMSEMNLAKKK
jgi:hypothetical protein